MANGNGTKKNGFGQSVKLKLRWIILCGGIGGILSVVHRIALGGPGTINGALQLLAIIVMGMIAALFGVFVLLTPGSMTREKLIVFAVFCGFAWKPVLDNVIKAGNEVKDHRELSGQVSELDSLQEQVKTASHDQIAGLLEEIATKTERLQQTDSTNIYSSRLMTRRDKTLLNGLEIAETYAPANPESAMKIWEQSAIAGVTTASPEVAEAAAKSLSNMGKDNPDKALQVIAKLGSILSAVAHISNSGSAAQRAEKKEIATSFNKAMDEAAKKAGFGSYADMCTKGRLDQARAMEFSQEFNRAVRSTSERVILNHGQPDDGQSPDQ